MVFSHAGQIILSRFSSSSRFLKQIKHVGNWAAESSAFWNLTSDGLSITCLVCFTGLAGLFEDSFLGSFTFFFVLLLYFL